jgi:hypothetical protein
MSSIKASFIKIVYWASYVVVITGTVLLVTWVADSNPGLFKNDWYWFFLVHTSAPAAIAYFIASLCKRNICWVCAAGISFGLGLHLILLMIRPEGYVFSPFVDNAIRGTAAEDVIWLVSHMILSIGIGVVCVKQLRI